MCFVRIINFKYFISLRYKREATAPIAGRHPKSFPQIKITGYKGPGAIWVQAVDCDDEFKSHPNSLFTKGQYLDMLKEDGNGDTDKTGIIIIFANLSTDMLYDIIIMQTDIFSFEIKMLFYFWSGQGLLNTILKTSVHIMV
jgi:hypothetical protein